MNNAAASSTADRKKVYAWSLTVESGYDSCSYSGNLQWTETQAREEFLVWLLDNPADLTGAVLLPLAAGAAEATDEEDGTRYFANLLEYTLPA